MSLTPEERAAWLASQLEERRAFGLPDRIVDPVILDRIAAITANAHRKVSS